MFKKISIITFVIAILVSGFANANAKGNRKVSIKLSGWVSKSVMWWDDGVNTNSSNISSKKKTKDKLQSKK